MLEKDVDNIIRRFAYYQFNSKKNDMRHVNREYDDVLQEARLTAMKAVNAYNDNKGTKLTTFATRCVLNRFKDLNKMSGRKLRYELHEGYEGIETTYSPWRGIDLDICLKQLLNDYEYFIYRARAERFSYKEIVEILNDRTDEEFDERRVKKCFSHIMQKLRLKGGSQAVV